MSIFKHLEKDNLHHAYLIEGARNEIISEIFKFCESINIKTSGNPDFVHIAIDNFKIEEALELRSISSSKSFSPSKKIFVISINTISLDAQGVLLKMFEEPIKDTHFFLIMPDTNVLAKTVVSRFYLIRREEKYGSYEEVERFVAMPTMNRINFIKELLAEVEEEDEEGNEIVTLDSPRAKAIEFLNALEFVLHKKTVAKTPSDVAFFEHLLKVREFLRMPGSSAKNLLESIALIIPIY